MTTMPSTRVNPSAEVDDDRAVLGAGTLVWHLAQVREHAVAGSSSFVGRWHRPRTDATDIEHDELLVEEEQ